MSELYLFTTAQGIKFPFSPSIFSKTFAGDIYVPTTCSRGDIQLHENLVKSEVVFTFPVTNTFAKLCIDAFIEGEILVEIFKDAKPFWVGRVVKATLSGKSINISCDSGYNRLYRKTVGATLSYYCWKTLYSTQCGVSEAGFSVSKNTFGLSGTLITFSSDVSLEDNSYSGGIAVLGNQVRGILTSSATNITITDSFIPPAAGTLILKKGCSLTRTSCIGFNNLNNFGGFPYVPVSNPFSTKGLL